MWGFGCMVAQPYVILHLAGYSIAGATSLKLFSLYIDVLVKLQIYAGMTYHLWSIDSPTMLQQSSGVQWTDRRKLYSIKYEENFISSASCI